MIIKLPDWFPSVALIQKEIQKKKYTNAPFVFEPPKNTILND